MFDLIRILILAVMFFMVFLLPKQWIENTVISWFTFGIISYVLLVIRNIDPKDKDEVRERFLGILFLGPITFFYLFKFKKDEKNKRYLSGEPDEEL